MDPAYVLNVVAGVLTADNAVRREAELTLAKLGTQPGLGPAILAIISRTDLPKHIRQSAGVFLKKLIEKNWSCTDDEEGAEVETDVNVVAVLSAEHKEYERQLNAVLDSQIEIPEADKVVLRAGFPALLADDLPELRVCASVCIAAIAQHDYPDAWPDLLPNLIQAISSLANVQLVQGALRCLSIILEDVIDTRVVAMTAQLFPALLHIAGHKDAQDQWAYPAPIRADALLVFVAFINTCTVLSDPGAKAFERTYQAHLQPVLPQLLPLISAILTAPVPRTASAPADSSPVSLSAMDAYFLPLVCAEQHQHASIHNIQNMAMFAVRAAGTRVFSMLLSYFPKLIKQQIPTLLAAVNSAVALILPSYVSNLLFPAPPVRAEALLEATGRSQLAPVMRGVWSAVLDETREDSVACGLSACLDAALEFLSLLCDHSTTVGKCLRTQLHVVATPVALLSVLTEADVEDYELDLNTFAAAEEQTDYDTLLATGGASSEGTVKGLLRKQATALTCAILDRWPRTGAEAVANAVLQLLQLADAPDAAQVPSPEQAQGRRWKVREAATLCAGLLMLNSRAMGKQTVLDAPNILNHVLLPALNAVGGDAAVFLRARGAWLLSPVLLLLATRLQDAAGKNPAEVPELCQWVSQLVALAVQCLSASELPVKLAAARSLRMAGMALLTIDSLMLRLNANNALQQAGLPQLPTGGPLEAPITGPQGSNALPISFSSCLQQHYPAVLAALCELLPETDGEALLLALEALSWLLNSAHTWYDTAVDIAADAPVLHVFASEGVLCPHLAGAGSTVADHARAVAESVLQCWASNSHDHNVHEVVVDCFKALCALSGAQSTIAATAYPLLLQLLQREEAAGDHEQAMTTKIIAMGLTSILIRSAARGPHSLSMVTLRPLLPQFAKTITHPQQARLAADLRHIAADDKAKCGLLAEFPSSFAYIPSSSSALAPAAALDVLLPTVLAIGDRFDERTVVQGTAALSSSIVAIYNVHMDPEQHAPLVQRLLALVMKLFTKNQGQPDANGTHYTDFDAVFACRLLTQLFAHFHTRILRNNASPALAALAPLFSEVLSTAVRTLLASPTHSLQVALLTSLVRIILANPAAYMGFLQSMQEVRIESTTVTKPARKSKKTGKWLKATEETTVKNMQVLPEVLNLILTRFEDLHSPYPSKLVLSLLMHTLSTPALLDMVRNAAVDDDLPVDTSSGVRTRRSAAIQAPSKTNAVLKMMSVVSNAGQQLRVLAAGEGDEPFDLFDGSDDEAEEAEGEPEDTASPLPKGNFMNAPFADADGEFDMSQLSDLLDMEELQGDGQDNEFMDLGADMQDFPECCYDALAGVDLLASIDAFARDVDADVVRGCLEGLGAKGRESVLSMLHAVKRDM